MLKSAWNCIYKFSCSVHPITQLSVNMERTILGSLFDLLSYCLFRSFNLLHTQTHTGESNYCYFWGVWGVGGRRHGLARGVPFIALQLKEEEQRRANLQPLGFLLFLFFFLFKHFVFVVVCLFCSLFLWSLISRISSSAFRSSTQFVTQ